MSDVCSSDLALVGGLVSFRVPVKNDIEYQGQSERVVGLRRLGEAEPPDVLSGQRGGVQQLLVQVGEQLGRAQPEHERDLGELEQPGVVLVAAPERRDKPMEIGCANV